MFIAEEVRELMAQLGFRTVNEMVGQVGALDTAQAAEHWKAHKLDLAPVLHEPESAFMNQDLYCSSRQDHGLDKALDQQLIVQCREALDRRYARSGSPRRSPTSTAPSARCSATRSPKPMAARVFPDGTIDITFDGSAGNSFGAFVPKGITLRVYGDANDYVGKGLSGGRIVVRPSEDAPADYVAEDNIIAGNVVLFGATSGQMFLRGQVGERFAVRNSGAHAVVEGVGDHGCEYMTGGRVVILGPTGRNFAAGMSGGIAYVYDPADVLADNLNAEMVELEEIEGVDSEDAVFIRDMIAAHVDATDSAVGQRILADWNSELTHFKKVMPRDFKRVLQAIADAEQQRSTMWTRRSWRPQVPDPRGFIKYTHRETAAPAAGGPAAARLERGLRGLPPRPRSRVQATRCMDCGIPFCHNGCPLGNLIPEWNDLVRTDRWRDAIERLHATNNFPEFTGRLCPAPCEGSCVLGINQDPVTIKQIEVEIIDNAFDEGWVVPLPPDRLTGKKVAVVGSGPAGLAAAQQLTRAGHEVTVFERDDRIGGLLRYGIPEFKMEKRHIDRRLEQMRAEGTQFRTGVNVGVDITAAQLRSEFDAVVLAGGATARRDLPIPGRDLDGIHQAMEYLPWANRVQLGDPVLDEHGEPPITAKDKQVIIIGGGDTGADCLGTAHRQGAAHVHQFEIMPRPPETRADSTPWPTYPLMYRVTSAHEEGGDRVYSVNTEEFFGENGHVTGLRGYEVEMRAGKFEKVDGTDFEMAADLVLLAMGFTGPERTGLLDDLGVEINERGNVARDDAFATSVPGVYVAGDMGRGQSLIVWAIAEGRAAASAVDRHLMGQTALPAPIKPTAVPQR